MEISSSNNAREIINIHITRGTQEIKYNTFSGCLFLFINLFLFFGGIAIIAIVSVFEVFGVYALCFPMLITSFILFFGFFTLRPNEVALVTLCGSYKGTVLTSGYHWINPFSSIQVISIKSRNCNVDKLKVNDKIGNPIEIGIVVVWRVKNAAQAVFDVENFEQYMHTNSESAVRHIALLYAYDKKDDSEISLRSGSETILVQLVKELDARLEKAGIEVQEARITHLAYASEIANVMLKRQQAEAIIAAREKIVQGAVSIVGHALSSLKENNIVDMKDDEKSRLVSNMLVVLCSESQVNPVVNTGI